MKFLNTERDIREAIYNAGQSSKKVAGQFHLAAVSILRKWAIDGNVACAVKLANELIEAMHGSTRTNALKDWFIGFAGFVWADNEFAYHKDRTTIDAKTFQAAMREPFWKYSKEPEYKPLDLDAALETLLKRAEKRRLEGLKEGDNVPAERIKAIRALLKG